MEKIVVQGGDNRLVGSVTIEGAKNAVLPLLAATILASKGKTVLQNVPILSDVFTMNQVVRGLNAKVDFESYSASLAGQEVAINAKELEILDYLVKNEGRALTRSQIIDAVWKATDEVPFDRVIDVYIKELRKKLDLDCILTVRNVGYKLERK